MLPPGDRARRAISYAYSATNTKRAAEHSTAPLLRSERVTKMPKIGRKTPKNEVAERGSAKWHCRITACLVKGRVGPSIREADLAPLAPTLSLTKRALRKRSGV